jgi:UPF0042 nucleotide-binding protein
MRREVIIITGMSGSGKSTVARTLEDVGFFCVDNIPVDLLPKLLELSEAGGNELGRLALVIDLRQREFLPRYSSVLAASGQGHPPLEIIFLDARDEVLVRRYSETRRQHPLATGGTLLDGIRKEREQLKSLKEKADWVIDTSDMTVHQLREEITKIFGILPEAGLTVVVNSFGFGKGLPVESDLVLDVRFLPNPHFVDELRQKDGRDPEVAAWVTTHEATRKFLEKLNDMLTFLLPLYIKEGKRYLTISIGCTGGKHRSVVVAEYIYNLLVRRGYPHVELRHRELATT